MSRYRIRIPRLDPVAQAIGYVCIFWVWLEDAIDEAIQKMAPLDAQRLLARERDEIANVLSTLTDVHGKVQALRALAFLRKFDDPWFSKMDGLLTEIDSKLRPARNRFVHDLWSAPSGKLHRRTRSVKITKPQAFVRILVTEQKTSVKTKEVWDLGKSVINAEMKLISLLLEHESTQKFIDEEVQKKTDENLAKQIAAKLASLPSKLPRQHPLEDQSKIRKYRLAASPQKPRRPPTSSQS